MPLVTTAIRTTPIAKPPVDKPVGIAKDAYPQARPWTVAVGEKLYLHADSKVLGIYLGGGAIYEHPVRATRVIGDVDGYGSLQQAQDAVAKLFPATPDAIRVKDMRNAVAYIINQEQTKFGALELTRPFVTETIFRKRLKPEFYASPTDQVVRVEDGRGLEVAKY